MSISHSVKVLVAQSCLTLCEPMDYSLPGSSVHGVFQARTLEWVVIPFSRGSSWPRDWTQVSCTAGKFYLSHQEMGSGEVGDIQHSVEGTLAQGSYPLSKLGKAMIPMFSDGCWHSLDTTCYYFSIMSSHARSLRIWLQTLLIWALLSPTSPCPHALPVPACLDSLPFSPHCLFMLFFPPSPSTLISWQTFLLPLPSNHNYLILQGWHSISAISRLNISLWTDLTALCPNPHHLPDHPLQSSLLAPLYLSAAQMLEYFQAESLIPLHGCSLWTPFQSDSSRNMILNIIIISMQVTSQLISSI